MTNNVTSFSSVVTFDDFAQCADYSLLTHLNADPHSTSDGTDYFPRQVYSGHYVPVKPTPIASPVYITHSSAFFDELGIDNALAKSEPFLRLFSGDMNQLPESMTPYGWATGYALSIYGTEYTQQCPFQTGNGYGDGRAISVFEGVLNGKRWEMQLKGAGPTPYCRGADGRAVLRSSVREFLAQEHMHALGIPTSRSLSLIVSQTDKVDRPWYYEGSHSTDPEIMVSNPIAISTRVAPSFLRVGQLELFGRRARQNAQPHALKELEMIVLHLIEREYATEIDASLPLEDKIIALASLFQERLTSLVTDWLRVGYCQGNFNSDNCAGGGFTLDYGPFGFCEMFDPVYQPWTGGGRHFSFFNQPIAAQKNYDSFCSALAPLLPSDSDSYQQLGALQSEFGQIMELKIEAMWASKLGLQTYDSELLVSLLQLMVKTSVDYTMLFRELSYLPSTVDQIERCFYKTPSAELSAQWEHWLQDWTSALDVHSDEEKTALSSQMKQTNPKYTWREWLVVPAYKAAETGNFELIHTLQAVLAKPYDEQSKEIEEMFYQRRPSEYFHAGGVSHYSCSS